MVPIAVPIPLISPMVVKISLNAIDKKYLIIQVYGIMRVLNDYNVTS